MLPDWTSAAELVRTQVRAFTRETHCAPKCGSAYLAAISAMMIKLGHISFMARCPLAPNEEISPLPSQRRTSLAYLPAQERTQSSQVKQEPAVNMAFAS